MTSIRLRSSNIKAYMGGDSFNACHDISRIHAQVKENNPAVIKVKALIPAASTRQGNYSVSVRLITQEDGQSTRILGSSCTCPIGYKCKHIHKVLKRIGESVHNPIPGPSAEYLAEVARRQELNDLKDRGACVYIALTCKSELDSGSDYRYSYYIKDNFDQEILGVFFSLEAANQCAKEYVKNELGQDIESDDDDDEEEEEDDDDNDEDDDYEEEYVFDGSDEGIFCDDYPNAFHKVWVESRAIEDASRRFHP